MLNKFKSIMIREDGYLQVQLKKSKDYDDYVFQKILDDPQIIDCIKDVKSKLKFYYDLSGYVSLKTYLMHHEFNDELLAFLILLYRNIVTSKTFVPLLCDLEYIFIHEKEAKFYFIGLPTAYEVSQNDHQCLPFSQSLLTMINSKQYHVIGYFYHCIKQNISFHNLLNAFIDFDDQLKKQLPWYKKIFLKNTITMIEDIPKANVYIRNMNHNHQQDMATMVLLSDEPYFEHVESKKIYLLNQDRVQIGRNQNNDLCLNNAHISSIHACFYKQSQILEDLDSSNGTYVNGEKISKQQLKDLDHICFAKEELIFHES